MLDRVISYSFYLLFFLTPLFWTSLNHELFEYNKMILTYGLTTIIVGSWVLKMIREKICIFKRTPLDIPLLLFLVSQMLSTIFSIDRHTSIWGYYSRSNGGLLSIISYLLLYFAFVSNMDKSKIFTSLKFALASGVVVSLWGILEHFGVSPSCLILRGEFNASCWIQDVQARVFATLGQPNWMAGYLGMLIFPTLYFFLTAKTRLTQTTYYLLLTAFYLAFTFTYSRGPTLGLIGGFIVFILIYLKNLKFEIFNLNSNFKLKIKNYKPIILILISFLFINLLFGSALTSFRLVSKFAPPPRPTISLPPPAGGSGTQLETGGTESGQIRLIVWQGALEIFKHYPIFGSGVETFAYSYYQFRPVSHNLTSEWDFLYNKTHNEYLNYLATTGIVGFGTYMLVITAFVFWSIFRIFNFQFLIFNKNFKFQISNFKTKESDLSLIISILASYISYLVYNFFLFSVVIIAIFFYLFPALAFVATGSVKPLKIPSTPFFVGTSFHSLFSIFQLVYRRPLYTKIAQGIIIFSTFYLLFSIFQLWYADTLFAKGEKASDSGNPGRAYNLLAAASDLNKGEPLYRSELAFATAQAAESLSEVDASLSASLKNQAINEMEKVLAQNPKNVSFLRSAIRTYAQLANLDNKFLDQTLIFVDRAIMLAPTDPKLYYNKALILEQTGKNKEAVEVLKKALELKPDYLEAINELKEATRSGTP